MVHSGQNIYTIHILVTLTPMDLMPWSMPYISVDIFSNTQNDITCYNERFSKCYNKCCSNFIARKMLKHVVAHTFNRCFRKDNNELEMLFD